MNELDRIFQSDDMHRLRLVNFVEQRRERSRFSAASCAGDKNQSGFLLGDFMEDGRQSQLFDCRHMSFEFAQNDREISLLPEDVDAETRFVAKGVAQIARTAGQIIVDQPPIALHKRKRDLLGLIRRECFNRRIDKHLF